MQKKIMYVCELCGTEYTEEKKCEECEKGHKKAKKIEKCKYSSIFANKPGYPTFIHVQMDDGTTQTYKKA